MKIIVGLGNPGEKYLKTRHNVGFMVVDRFAQQLEVDCTQRKFQSLFCKKSVEQEDVVLLKPQTYMNLSGVAVKEVMDMYKCPIQDIMVVCDDLDMSLGKIRIRRNGGCGGHRGLKSIAERLGSTDFARLKIGIGRPMNEDPSDYVLSAFTAEEDQVKAEVIDNACQALKTWMFEGVEACMNKFN